jgi:hypothetical protein
VDMVFDDPEKYKQSLNAVEPLTTNFKVLGTYKRGDKSFNEIHQI